MVARPRRARGSRRARRSGVSEWGGDTPLGWAVVAHRLPVGFAIVVAAHASRKSAMVSWGLSLTMVGATVLGYVSGPSVVAWLSESAPAALEAIVAGVLLHVVLVPHATAPEARTCGHASQAPTAVQKHRGCSHNHDHSHGHHQATVDCSEAPAASSTPATW